MLSVGTVLGQTGSNGVYDFIELTKGQKAPYHGIFFHIDDVPNLLFDLERLPVLFGIKNIHDAMTTKYKMSLETAFDKANKIDKIVLEKKTQSEAQMKKAKYRRIKDIGISTGVTAIVTGALISGLIIAIKASN
jgi:hypothetical protein